MQRRSSRQRFDAYLKARNATSWEVMEKSENIGMKTFDSALFELYREGLISEDEALRNADSPNNVRLKIKFANEGGGDDGLGGLSLQSLEDEEDAPVFR